MKKNIINFIPKTEFVPAYAPMPEPMSKNLPEWWRKQPAYTTGSREIKNGQANETIKKCPGIQDLLFSGYMLKTPCDIFVDTTGEKLIFDIADLHKESISMHTREQVTGWDYDREKYMEDVFRIHPMWIVHTSPGISTFFIHPSFNESLPFKIVPAIVDTDMYPADGPFGMLFEKGFKGVIKQGTPLVQCIPFKREPFTMNILDKPSLKLLNTTSKIIRSKVSDAYKTFLWEKKVFK